MNEQIKEKLLIDGVSYNPYNYKSEEEFEEMIREHYKEIFGDNSLYFGKQKIRSKAGVGSIPDGFIITLYNKPGWYIIEVELSSHPPYEHAEPQLKKFKKAIENSETRKKIVDEVYNDIKSDALKESLIKNKISSGEIHKFLFDLITINNFNPLIIIDKITDEWKEAFDDFLPKIKFIEFKTFERGGVGLGVHAHLFEPIYAPTIQIGTIKKPEEGIFKSNEIEKQLILDDIKKIDLHIEPSWINYKVICIPTKYKNFFPQENQNFIMEIDNIPLEKHIASLKIGMKDYYRKHPELKAGDKLIIEAIEPKKRYKLKINE